MLRRRRSSRTPPRAGARSSSRPSPRSPSAIVYRPEPERRPASEPLGRRAIAKDQAADDPPVVGILERLGDGGEPTVADLDLRSRVVEQVQRPERAIAGGH